MAGIVHALGSEVTKTREFVVGDRVAAFHPMMSPHGAFAEYAVAPYHTVFKLPDKTSFEGKSFLIFQAFKKKPSLCFVRICCIYVNYILTYPYRSSDHPSRGHYCWHNTLSPSRSSASLVPSIFGESPFTTDSLRRIWRSGNLCSQACSCFKHPSYHRHRGFKLIAPWSITRQIERRRTCRLPRRS